MIQNKRSLFFSLLLFLYVISSVLPHFKLSYANTPTPTPSPTTPPGAAATNTPTPIAGGGSTPIGGGSQIQQIVCGCPIKDPSYYRNSKERCIELPPTSTDRVADSQRAYAEFEKNPMYYHLWVESEEVTSQGKADERARQFIYWVLRNPSIDDHKTLKDIWAFSRNVALFFVLLIAAIFGLGIIVAQRQEFDLKVDVSPLIIKLIVMLLYIVLSASIVLTVIQISEILMKFFIENLGGNKLFNIYFSGVSAEKNYTDFIGCRDLNWSVQEAYKTEMFLLKLTNVTYYVMGVMLLLRKILLWFLLFVSPFLALLMPFIFIRNVGWIWIGVFFQWVFYGPLFALFLGGLAQIWQHGIPFPFNFSRTNTAQGYIYPTAFNIAYGGPAQVWGPEGSGKENWGNNGNYIDTYAEYIITLIMLWAVTFFPWWLLRIFRDYCCDGIMAMKNILMSMYDQMRGGPTLGPGPTPAPVPTGTTFNTGTAMKMPEDTRINAKVHMETIEEIRQMKTEDISRNLSISMTKLTDIARFETNKTTNQTVNKTIDYLKNPMKAETPQDRQKYMNLRTELFNRAIKEDTIAKQILSSTSTSKVEQIEKRNKILKSTTQAISTPATKIVSIKYKVSNEKVQAATSSFLQTVSQQTTTISNIAQKTQVSQSQIQSVIKSYIQNINQPANQIINSIMKETNLTKEKISEVLKQTNTVIQQYTMMRKTANHEHINRETANHIINTLPQVGLNRVQLKQLVTTYAEQMDKKPAAQIAQEISVAQKIEKEKVQQTIQQIQANVEASKQVVKAVAQSQNLKEEEVENIVQEQIPLVAEPEKHIAESIAVPPSVSQEDYEEVKKMWHEQYEKGEVPESETIKSRAEWIEKDITLITNTINKLFSNDEKLQQEGLDDVGYLLPIFMINNMSGDELIVYLKAKLEAAKAVQEILVPPEEEEFVEVAATKKKEEAKTMEMSQAQEMELPKEKKLEDEKQKEQQKTDEKKDNGSDENKPEDESSKKVN